MVNVTEGQLAPRENTAAGIRLMISAANSPTQLALLINSTRHRGYLLNTTLYKTATTTFSTVGASDFLGPISEKDKQRKTDYLYCVLIGVAYNQPLAMRVSEAELRRGKMAIKQAMQDLSEPDPIKSPPRARQESNVDILADLDDLQAGHSHNLPYSRNRTDGEFTEKTWALKWDSDWAVCWHYHMMQDCNLHSEHDGHIFMTGLRHRGATCTCRGHLKADYSEGAQLKKHGCLTQHSCEMQHQERPLALMNQSAMLVQEDRNTIAGIRRQAAQASGLNLGDTLAQVAQAPVLPGPSDVPMADGEGEAGHGQRSSKRPRGEQVYARSNSMPGLGSRTNTGLWPHSKKNPDIELLNAAHHMAPILLRKALFMPLCLPNATQRLTCREMLRWSRLVDHNTLCINCKIHAYDSVCDCQESRASLPCQCSERISCACRAKDSPLQEMGQMPSCGRKQNKVMFGWHKILQPQPAKLAPQQPAILWLAHLEFMAVQGQSAVNMRVYR